MYNKIEDISSYVGMDLPISSANINHTGHMLNSRAKYTARTGMAIISTANSNRDGTGTIADLIAGNSWGVVVYKIIIKAQGSTTQGMIRIYHKDGSTTRLIREVPVPAITQSAKDQTIVAVIDEPFYLKDSTTYKLRVSTEKAETFIVIAEGMEQTYPA